MLKKTRYRRAGQASRWVAVREALNVAAAVGTVMIGIGTLWITARISGLEGYFQSEMSARNGQLVSVIRQNERAAGELLTRERQLAALGSRTDEAIITALATQAQLSASTASLLGVQNEVELERNNLGIARTELASLQALTSVQQAALLSLYAREAYDRSVLVGSGAVLRIAQSIDYDEPRAEIRSPVGRLLTEALSRLAQQQARDQQTYPVYQQIVASLPVVCPGFAEREVVYPAIPERTPFAPAGYPRSMSADQVRARTQELQRDDTAAILARRDVIIAAIETGTNSSTEFLRYANGCLCEAAAAGGQDKAVVCPRSD